MKARITLILASATLCATSLAYIPSSTSGASTATIPVSVGHLGGARTFSATVAHVQRCVWTSSPRIRGFDVSVRCKSGKVSRTAIFPANSSNTPKRFTVTLWEIGQRTIVVRWKVTEAGLPTTTTTTSTLPVTTTTSTTTTTTIATTHTPYTYMSGVDSCTGVHIDATGQTPEDVETCQISSSNGMNAGSFASAPGSPSGLNPYGFVSTWGSDYYPVTSGQPVLASSWSITAVINSNGTATWYIDAHYASQSV